MAVYPSMHCWRCSSFALLALCIQACAALNCLGEFSLCADGSCTLTNGTGCGLCAAGEYLCPSDQRTCVPDAASYVHCPGLRGTHLDWTLPLDARLDYLANITTLDEQVSQLRDDAPQIEHLGIPAYEYLNDDVHGVRLANATQFPNGCALGATWSTATLREVAAAMAHEARGAHNGFVHMGYRSDPPNGYGITMYGPNINLVHDPRWGRNQEVYSEDPLLTSELAVAFVQAAQTGLAQPKGQPAGSSGHRHGNYTLAAACCKHLAAYTVETIPRERYSFDARVDARNMWETYMPAFKACVQRAEAAHVMCSYNAINGVPACGEPKLLNGVLRDQWDFKGFVVSDYDAWAWMKDYQRYVPTYEAAAAVGINAGLDQEGGCYGGCAAVDALPAAVQAGLVKERAIAAAFRRLMRVRIQLGMLDPPTLVPHNYIASNATNLLSSAHRAVALRAAREAICLYKNNPTRADIDRARSGRRKHRQAKETAPVLPLSVSNLRRAGSGAVALVGPQAVDATLLNGNYACGDSDACPPSATLHDALVRAIGSENAVTYAPGCADVLCTNRTGFAAAEAAARSASAVVVMIGLTYRCGSWIYPVTPNGTRVDGPYCPKDPSDPSDTQEGEGRDRATIELNANQAALVAVLRRAAGPEIPVVGVLVHGGAVALGATRDKLDALLDAWQPGMAGGTAIAEVLFGAYNPAGRSPVTWYRSTTDLPRMGEMDLYNGPKGGLTYRYFAGDVEVPFGFGLSYTKFSYEMLRVDTPQGNTNTTAPVCSPVSVHVRVRNIGLRDGDEVVQLYLTQLNASAPVPRVRLGAFERIHIAAGKSIDLALTAQPDMRSTVLSKDAEFVYKPAANVVVEPGTVQLFVGGGQPAFFAGGVQAHIRFVGARRPLASCV